MLHNSNNIKATTMELNKLSVSIISVLVTLAICLGGFSYKTGVQNNKISNLECQNVVIKEDFNKQIDRLEDKKADKVVVEMIYKKIDEMNDVQKETNRINREEHKQIIDTISSMNDNLINRNK